MQHQAAKLVCWLDHYNRVPSVVLRNGQLTHVMRLQDWNDDRDYGPRHKSLRQMAIEQGFVETKEDPRNFHKCDGGICVRTDYCVKRNGPRPIAKKPVTRPSKPKKQIIEY